MKKTTTEQNAIRLRLFGLRGSNESQIETQSFPFSSDLTVATLWSKLQHDAEPGSPMVSLARNRVLALVNGVPIQRLTAWETPLNSGDTVTFMVKAFGG